MNFIQLVKTRYSVRTYQNKMIEKEKLIQVLEAGRLAPSAANKQPWHFLVIQDKKLLEAITKAYAKDWLKSAPAIIVVYGDHNQSWKRTDGKDHCDIDIAIAIDHMTLAAAELGLGTCWVCMFDAVQVHQILELAPNLEVMALLPIGYPSDQPSERHLKRKSLEEIVTWS